MFEVVIQGEGKKLPREFDFIAGLTMNGRLERIERFRLNSPRFSREKSSSIDDERCWEDFTRAYIQNIQALIIFAKINLYHNWRIDTRWHVFLIQNLRKYPLFIAIIILETKKRRNAYHPSRTHPHTSDLFSSTLSISPHLD